MVIPMNDEISISREDFSRLNERVKRLAEEKSFLELFTHLMEKMSSVSGLENTISNLFQIILENIGGSNIIIYYLIDSQIFYADVLGRKEPIKEINDSIVKKVFETKTSFEQQSSFDNTKLISSEFTKANIWAFPLLVGAEVIAVIKIENLYATTSDLRFHLPTFFSFVAHILQNEILGYTKLKTAYEELSLENNLRKQAEEELRQINEELEDRVEERTIELHHANVQLEDELAVRQRAESQIRKLNRIYAVLSNINQAIVRIRNTKEVFDEACRIATEYGKFTMVWIGIINAKNNKVEVAASSGVESSYLDNLVIDLNDVQRSSGPTGIAIRTGKHKISNNIIDDDSMLLWKNEAIQYGYKSTASFPLIVFGKVVGAFCIYSDELSFFEDDDVVLLDEMVKDISFAMEFIESEAERRDAENALYLSEERFRRLAENAPDVIYRMSLADGKYEYISPAALTIFGYSPDDYYDNPLLFKQSIHPDWIKYFEEHWANLQKGIMPLTYEYQIIHKSGEARWLNQRNILVLDEGGNSVAIEGVVTDITERKQAEQALQKAAEEIRDLYNNAPCGYHSLDKDGTFVRINNTELKWLGYTLEEVIGKMKFTDIITPKSLKTFNENFPGFKEKGWIKNLEFELIRKDGSILPILASATAIKDSDGNYLMSRSTVYDITERKIAELQLRNSEREFRTLAENLPDHIIRYDIDCRVIYLNHVLAAANYTNSSLVGKLSAEIQFNEAKGLEEYNEKLRRVIKTGAEDEMEIMLRDIEGNLHIHEVHFLAERDIEGKIVGALAIGHDISERKQAEEERQANLRFFENMDRINRAIQEANNVEQMMSDVLDIILSTFDCDRASFIYPCDIEASSWKVPIERTKPEHPGAMILGVEIPVDSEAIRVFNAVLAASYPVGFGPGNEEPLPQKVSESFNIKSQLAISLHPKIDKPWMFVLHQCSKNRSWTSEEKKLLKEISTRLTDGLTSLLTLRNLSESERRLTEAQRIANVGYWERDFVNNKIILSDESCRIFGLPQENYHKELDEWHKQWLQLILPEDKVRTERAVIDAVQKDIPYNLDYRIIRHDGELRYIHSEANVRRDSSGKPIFMLGMMQDITVRKRAEESLLESETKLRIMFENSRDALGVSKKGVHVFANPAYLKLFGYEKLEEIVGTSILECIAPSHHQQIIENVKRRDSGEEIPSFYETRGRKRDGSEFDFEINISTYELNGEIYTLANIRDITSRKLLEKSLFFVAERGWQTGEENFFDSLAQFLGENLDMDYVVVDKLDDNPEIAETIALYAKGSIVPNIRYALKGTPCENVMGRQLCFYPKEVQKLFPDDKLLLEMGVDSYMGIPLWDSFGKPIGLIALMSSKQHPEDSIAIQVLQLVATRAAAELERDRSDRILRKREYEFRTLAESLPDNIVRYDRNGRTVYVNPILEKTLATGASAMIGTTIRELNPDGSFESYAQAVDNALASGENSELEILVPNPNNEQIVHQIRIIAERDEQNKVTSVLAIGRDITERKRAEETIKKSEAQLNEAQRIAQIGSWELDIANNILRWSDEIFRIFEIDPKEFGASYEAFLDAIHPDDREVVNTAYSNSLVNRTPYAIDHRLRFDDGRIKFVHEQCETIYNEENKPLRSIGTVQDITDRKLAEEALKESEEKYRTLIQKIQTAVIVHTPDTQILICNHSAEILLGLSEDQLLGKKAIDPAWHFYREDGTVLPLEEYPVNCVLATRKELRNYVVGVHRTNNKNDVWVLVNADPVWSNENELTQVIVTFSDITMRKNAEVALKLSEERYRTLVEQAMDGIFIADSIGNYIDVNRSGCNMLGYTRDQLLKLRMQDLIPAEEQKTIPIQFEKLRSGKTALAERNLIRNDGSLLPVEISGIMLPDKRFLGIVRDITERKKNEAALNERIKHSQSLLRLSKNLEMAQTYSQVLNAALNEVKVILGYQSLWVYLLSEDKKYFKALVASGDFADVVMSPEGTLSLTIAGDKMLEEIATAKDIVIVEDATKDERTDKKIVEALGNHTIINVPIYLFDKHLGTVGTGTFGSEGIRVPTHSEQEFLLAMASHLAVSLDRIHLLVERQEAEKALLRLNRELKAISNCNQSLLRAEDEQSLLNEICRIICEEAGYDFAWVGYTEHSDANTIHPVAWAGIDIDLKAKEKFDWSEEIECGLRPAQKVIQTGDIIYVQDFSSDVSLESWCQKALQRGYRSGMALPLKNENSQVFGVILIYSTNRNVITQDEIRLIEELANDLAFGIITLQTRAERKRVEKELELHRDHLQELVKVRTEELDKVNKKLVIEFEKEKEFERMLQHSLEKEKELSELKSRFISTTSHEFRTPLTTVRVSAEMIQRYRKRWTEDKLDVFLDKIKNSVDYLTKLLDDVLTISRSESGKIVLNKEEIDLHEFCLDVIEEAKISATEAHKLIFNFTLKKIHYRLDPKLMKFILLNLLSNAIKYSPKGGKIELTIKQLRGKMVISVKDKGIGIPTDDLKHLFEPFHRAKNTTDISGTGLGLSIVKRAVDLHNGIITVKSELNAGTTFTVKIPLEQ